MHIEIVTTNREKKMSKNARGYKLKNALCIYMIYGTF